MLARTTIPVSIASPFRTGQNANIKTDSPRLERIGGLSLPRSNFPISTGFLFMTNEKLLMALVRSGHLRITDDGQIWRGNKRAEMRRDDDYMIFGMVSGQFVRTTARRLVWQFFFGDIPARYRVALKDKSVTNNHPSNLELFRSPNRTSRRFWNFVEIGSDTECWPWSGCKNNKGYGMFTIGRHSPPVLANRFAFETRYSPLLQGECALHRCDNPACVNPLHLFRGSQLDNMRDCVAKGRQAAGEATGVSKLTNDAVVFIRDHYGKSNTKSLAVRFGVTTSAICYAANRRTWKHIK